MGLIVYIVVNIFLIVEMNGGGNWYVIMLWGVIVVLYDYDMLFVVVLVVFIMVFFLLMYMLVFVLLFIV